MAISGSPTTEGALSKWTNPVSGWQYRWLVLNKSECTITYYTSHEKLQKNSPKGVISLKDSTVVIESNNFNFSIHSEGKKYQFQAKDEREMDKWVRAIEMRNSGCHEKITVGSDEGYESTMDTLVAELRSSIPECLDQIDTDEEYFDAHSSPTMPTLEVTSPQDDVAFRYNSTPRSHKGIDNHLGMPNTVPRRVNSVLDIGKSPQRNERRASVLSESACQDRQELPESPSPINSKIVKDLPQSIDVIDDEIDDEKDISETIGDHKSIILHVLSQLRPGVDLTRITLPPFILEKRSHLEMLADMFSRAESFASVSTYDDPKDRLTACVKFYLGTFSAGRKGTLAKKPYNPILGEVFQCYYDLPNSFQVPEEDFEKKEELVDSGPVPWANYRSTTVLCEQISHHPPISAFYAECPLTGVSALGHIQTKSKFLGLSVGVYNIGTVSIYDSKHDELYITHPPTAYGRSVLTTPWMELGGKVTMDCPKTGCKALLELHTKPFYGGRKHRITGELFSPSNKKPFLKLDGEWNNIVESKQPNKETSQFFDAHSPITRKKIRKLPVMEPHESRRVWEHVTTSLRNGDEQAAGDAKHKVEETQREKAKARKESGEEWKQRHFVPGKEGAWEYPNDLKKRMEKLRMS